MKTHIAYNGSEAYKSVMGATAEQLRRRKPYTVAAIAFHEGEGQANAEQVKFFQAELDLIEERLAEMKPAQAGESERQDVLRD
jgi:hypothetical protein